MSEPATRGDIEANNDTECELAAWELLRVERKKNADFVAAVQILAKNDFGSQNWNFACEQAAMTLRKLLKNHD